MSLTNEQLDSLEFRAKAATPGPWNIVRDPDGYTHYIGPSLVTQVRDDAAYIAAVNPAVVLELIAELRKARAERDWAVKMVNSRLKFRICPTPERHEECHKEPRDTLMPQETCRACWLKAAREAVEEKP